MPFYKVIENYRGIKFLKGEFSKVPDLRDINSRNGYTVLTVPNYSQEDNTIFIPDEAFQSTIKLDPNSYYKGVFTAIVKHPEYGEFAASISYEKLFPYLFSEEGIKNGETPTTKLKIKRRGNGFGIEILNEVA